MRKKVQISIAFLLILTLVFSLAACGDSGSGSGSSTVADSDTETDTNDTDAPSAEKEPSDSSSSNGEETTIRIAWWGNQLRIDTTMAMLDAYSEENPHITFEAEFSDWSGYWDKVATQAASNNMPDILQQDYAYIDQYTSKGQLANLSELVDAGYLNVDNVAESILSAGMFDGDLYALVAGVNAFSFTYSSDILEEAGLTMPDRLTYSALNELNEAVYAATGHSGGSAAGVTEAWGLLMWAREVGESLYDGTTIGVSEGVLTEYFQEVLDNINSDWSLSVDVLIEAKTAGVEQSPIANGKSWITAAGSNMVAAYQAVMDDQLEIILWPKIDDAQYESMYLRPSMFWSIVESSTVKEEAAKVLDYYTNNETAQDHLKAERGVPISSVMQDYMRDSLDDVTRQHFDYIAEVTEIATDIFPPYPNGSNEVLSLHDDLVDLVRFGETTPADAAARFITEGNEILERAAE